MREKELEVLHQYDIDVRSTRRIRGAVLCDTNQGLFLLKEMQFSEKKLPSLCALYQYMKEKGYCNVDYIVKNKEESYWSVSEDETKYVLKKWYQGKECDNKKEKDILEAVQNLARLHQIMKGFQVEEIREKRQMQDEIEAHNKELRKVRSFIREKSNKNTFENIFLASFEGMYEWAKVVNSKLSDEKYCKLNNMCKTAGWIAHGDYNYHNILMTASGVATTNFERFHKGIPIMDFYYFLRKTMEKNQWDTKLGVKMIETYDSIQSISDVEMEYLEVCIAYPEKFWKVANKYYQSRKSWISEKNIEKLEMAIQQTEEKRKFLQTVFSSGF